MGFIELHRYLLNNRSYFTDGEYRQYMSNLFYNLKRGSISGSYNKNLSILESEIKFTVESRKNKIKNKFTFIEFDITENKTI